MKKHSEELILTTGNHCMIQKATSETKNMIFHCLYANPERLNVK